MTCWKKKESDFGFSCGFAQGQRGGGGTLVENVGGGILRGKSEIPPPPRERPHAVAKKGSMNLSAQLSFA